MYRYNKIFKNQLGLLQRHLNKSNKNNQNQNKSKLNNSIKNNNTNKTNNNNQQHDLMKIIDNSEVPVVVQFQPSIDLPIRRFNPHLEDVVKSRQGSNITLVKLDIDRDYDIVKKFKILEFPTILGVSRGKINIQLKGKDLSSKEINEFLNKLEESHYK